ncbi:NAD(P)-dependent oxidoreductase [Streptomyces sp. NPDC048277]|uniref:NAD(P)-dependent oxidoreductase n=1 Tax=Streptomyces sp. NPDC048277 TaxID=3155027 RepID=UPI0033CE7DF9
MSTRDTGPRGHGRPVVAVLGIGTMGDAMARNIAAAGLELRVWNRSREPAEALAEIGAVVCETPAEACRGAKVMLTILANERIVAETVDQAREGIDRDAVWLQCCTVSPAGSRRMADKATAMGVAYVEAPLLGTKEPAVAGTLTILAAASDMCAGERVQPVLDAVGTRTVWLDAISQPSSLKLAYNSWVLTTVEGVAEALALAEGLGVDPRQLINVINGSALNSTYVQSKGPKMISDDLDTPSFPLEAAAKDAGLIADAARDAGLELGIVEVMRDRLQLAVSNGLGRADVAATYRMSRRAPAA